MQEQVATSPAEATRRRRAPRLAIVVPCHNEEAALPATVTALRGLLADLVRAGQVAASSYICFVDDGSRDATWTLIERASAETAECSGLRLTRNFGHQGAVLAGMLECDADAVVTIDADLQDDERCIATMLERYAAGCDIVLGVRADRSSDVFFKRWTAELYYRLLRAMRVKVAFNHADFRLLSRRAIEALRQFEEANLFLRGLVGLVGLETATVAYSRRPRMAGESKYPLRKMLALAWEGITSFSVSPLRVISALGLVIAAFSFLITLWALFERFFGTGVVPGWASTVVPLYFLGGVQILCLGVIGEYVGKIYLETKRRPRYLVDERAGSALVQGPAAGAPAAITR